MSQIILDFGSGNTCKNNPAYARRMIDELKAVDTGKHEVIIKWQLFEHAPPNERLMWATYEHAVNYAYNLGYRTTASVFDMVSFKYLMNWNVPFVKIANRPDLYWLAGEVPRNIPVYASFNNVHEFWSREPAWTIEQPMWCVSKYPTTLEEYDRILNDHDMRFHAYPAISDHTTDFELWHKYKPEIIEWHYKLDDSTGPDAGEFARTPAMLAEIL
jgi:sialic acid synthase SpsE